MLTHPVARLQSALTRLSPPSDLDSLTQIYPGARLGAVLVLFYPHHGTEHLVLTRRQPDLRLHSGQISFPGGRVDPHDASPASAARRETLEEIGVSTIDLPLHGPLDPVYTVASNFVLAPFVAFASERPAFVPNPGEVAEIIEVPLLHLLQPATVQNEVWTVRGARRVVAFYRFGQHKIWGATARVLRQIIELAGGQPPPTGLLLPGDVVP